MQSIQVLGSYLRHQTEINKLSKIHPLDLSEETVACYIILEGLTEGVACRFSVAYKVAHWIHSIKT